MWSGPCGTTSSGRRGRDRCSDDHDGEDACCDVEANGLGEDAEGDGGDDVAGVCGEEERREQVGSPGWGRSFPWVTVIPRRKAKADPDSGQDRADHEERKGAHQQPGLKSRHSGEQEYRCRPAPERPIVAR